MLIETKLCAHKNYLNFYVLRSQDIQSQLLCGTQKEWEKYRIYVKNCLNLFLNLFIFVIKFTFLYLTYLLRSKQTETCGGQNLAKRWTLVFPRASKVHCSKIWTWELKFTGIFQHLFSRWRMTFFWYGRT